ncbi:uncharacterized protein JCM10292_004646 [Rhodotorula paludigena]|uniref:uncharacterized protein n=1 Tax=Rhodotorula paludigena TaxID=86838 RepID=UPI0031712F77
MQNVELRALPSLTPKYRAHLVKAQYLTAAEVLLTPPPILARRTKLPPADIAHLLDELARAVCSIEQSRDRTVAELCAGEEGTRVLTTGDAGLDELLGGGVRVGSLTEIAGQSSSGKTNICLQLCLTAQLPPEQGGLGGGALFVSSEGTLSSSRLLSMAEHLASTVPATEGAAPRTAWDFLDNVHTEKAPDVDTLVAVLSYHAPAAIERLASLAASSAPLPSLLSPALDPAPSQYLSSTRTSIPRPALPIRLLVVDSIAAPFRAETETGSSGFANRAKEFAQLGDTLKRLAHVYRLAVVVVNQVADEFEGRERPMPPSFLAHDDDAPAQGAVPPAVGEMPPPPPPLRPPFRPSAAQDSPAPAPLSRTASMTSSLTTLPPPAPHKQHLLPAALYSRFQSPHFSGLAASHSSPALPLPFSLSGAGGGTQAALGHSWSNVPSTRVLCLLRRAGEGAVGGTRRAAVLVWSAFAPRACVEYELREREGVRSVGAVRVRGVAWAEGREQNEQEEGADERGAERGEGEKEWWGSSPAGDGVAAWEEEADRIERALTQRPEGACADNESAEVSRAVIEEEA